jgi:hypothetical protein
MSDKSKPLDYNTSTPDSWLEAVSKWPWTELGPEKWKLSGPCPRCNHQMDRVLKAEFILGLRARPKAREGREEVLRDLEGQRPVVPHYVYVECNCGMPHTGRPNDESGCGPAGFIRGPASDNGGGRDA